MQIIPTYFYRFKQRHQHGWGNSSNTWRARRFWPPVRLEQDVAVGGVEEEDLVELLPFVLSSPEVEDAQLRPVGRGGRDPANSRPVGAAAGEG